MEFLELYKIKSLAVTTETIIAFSKVGTTKNAFGDTVAVYDWVESETVLPLDFSVVDKYIDQLQYGYQQVITIQCNGKKYDCRAEINLNEGASNFLATRFSGKDEDGNFWAEKVKTKTIGALNFPNDLILEILKLNKDFILQYLHWSDAEDFWKKEIF